MKKKLFIFCIYLFYTTSVQIFAQKTEYQPIFGETSIVYSVLYSYYADPESTISLTDVTFKFILNKDTTINGIEYKEFDVWVPASHGPFSSCFLRESEDHSKLYTLRWQGVYEEVLVMDLDLNLHDTFNCWGYTFIVENIFYDEANLKHILFSPINHIFDGYDSYYTFEFIEGIGFTAIFGLESRIGLLLCTQKDETHVFINNSDFLPAHIRGKCDYDHWSVEIENISILKSNLQIYPNPANKYIEIDLGEHYMNYQQLVVSDFLGKPCMTNAVIQKKQRIDIQNLPSGYYIVKAIGKDKSVYGKFSIIH